MQRILIAICVVFVLVGLVFLVCFCNNEARRAESQEHRERAMQSGENILLGPGFVDLF